MARTGRRPGDSGTREAILAAARASFAERGYAATLRQIGASAGVDPALVLHYFRSKHGLFVAAMELPFDPAEAIPSVLGDDLDGAGERVVRFFVGAWDAAAGGGPLVGLLRAATADPKAAEMMRQFLAEAGPAPALRRLGVSHSELRAGLIASQLLGLVIARHVLRLEPFAGLPPEQLVALVAPTVQRYLTGDLPLPSLSEETA